MGQTKWNDIFFFCHLPGSLGSLEINSFKVTCGKITLIKDIEVVFADESQTEINVKNILSNINKNICKQFYIS